MEGDLAFLSTYLGNPNLLEVKDHVMKVKQGLNEKKVHVYKCIKANKFLETRMANHFYYPKVFSLISSHCKTNAPATFSVADIGCCFGTDTRKLLLDGCLPADVYAIDILDDYWNIGLDLYCDRDRLKVNTLPIVL